MGEVEKKDIRARTGRMDQRRGRAGDERVLSASDEDALTSHATYPGFIA